MKSLLIAAGLLALSLSAHAQETIVEYLSDDEELIFEQEPMRAIVANNQLALYRHDGFWQCMDTYRDYKLLNDLWDRNEAPWRNW